jgi:four helix bundle protein
MQDFRNLDVWQAAHALTLDIYELTASFPDHERYGLISQMRRACSSMPMNIAEGCVRRTDADFARYLYNAMGSASELEYAVLLSRDLGYASTEDFSRLTDDVQRVKRMLTSFIRRLNGADPARRPMTEDRQPTAESR